MKEPVSKRVILGRISGVYGVRGWVRLESFTDPIKNILSYTPWQVGRAGTWCDIRLAEGRGHGKGLVARFDGIVDRDQAAALIGAEIAVDRDQLPASGDDEYYWTDLEGLMVITTAGVELGRVDNLLATGANDVLVVRGDRERLVPFIRDQVVRSVDLHAGLIRVDWDPDF